MFKVSGLLVLNILFVSLVTCQESDGIQIKFDLYNNGETSVSTFNTSMSEQGCDMDGNFSIVAHGWQGNSAKWVPDLISNLSHYRGGCLLYMNSTNPQSNYFFVVANFQKISELLARKLKQIVDDGASSDDIFMFGFSIGGRIVIEAGLLFGPQQIGQIDS